MLPHPRTLPGTPLVTGVDNTKDPLGNPQEWHIEDQEVEDLDGRRVTLSIYAREGAVGSGVMTDKGELVFLPLERVKTARPGTRGRYPFYGTYRLPPGYKTREVARPVNFGPSPRCAALLA